MAPKLEELLKYDLSKDVDSFEEVCKIISKVIRLRFFFNSAHFASYFHINARFFSQVDIQQEKDENNIKKAFEVVKNVALSLFDENKEAVEMLEQQADKAATKGKLFAL